MRPGLARAILSIGLLAAACTSSGDAPEPAGGMFLVADRSMPDPRFRESVVLIVDHDAQGTFGLVVNRPSEVAVADALAGLPEEVGDGHVIHIGGPVEPHRTVFLVRDRAPDDEALAVLDDVYMDSRHDTLVAALRERGPDGVRVFAGYAGWGPGQLEGELRREGWRLVAADAASVFSDDAGGLWQRLYRDAESRIVVDAGRRIVAGLPAHARPAGR